MNRDEIVALIAKVCHAVNRELQLAHADPDPSPKWEDAPAWQTESAIGGVKYALLGMDPEELHERWVVAKLADGWVYGEVKDAEAKTHPQLIPYHMLDAHQQIKDAAFLAIVDTLRPLLDQP